MPPARIQPGRGSRPAMNPAATNDNNTSVVREDLSERMAPPAAPVCAASGADTMSASTRSNGNPIEIPPRPRPGDPRRHGATIGTGGPRVNGDEDITRLLSDARAGDGLAWDRLVALVYRDLRQLAH